LGNCGGKKLEWETAERKHCGEEKMRREKTADDAFAAGAPEFFTDIGIDFGAY
jgi:hypothetical protein